MAGQWASSDETSNPLRAAAILLPILLLLSSPLAVALGQPGSGRSPGEQALNEGIKLFLQAKYASALPFLERATKLLPTDSRAWTWLGACYLRLGRLVDARKALERALSLDKSNAAAWLYIGVVRARQGQTAEAREAFHRVLSLDPAGDLALAAQGWLDWLTAAGSPAAALPSSPPPPPAAPGCPAAPKLPEPLPPPGGEQPRRIPPVTITDFTARPRGEQLILEGGVENNGNDDITNVVLQATGFDIGGRAVATGNITIKELELDEAKDFRLQIPLRVPLLWVRVRVERYEPRRPDEPLHTLQKHLSPRLFLTLAGRSVRVRAEAIPPGRATSHRICLAITEGGGVPLRAVRILATVSGTTGRGRTRVDRQVALVPERATDFSVTWPAPADPAIEVRVLELDVAE